MCAWIEYIQLTLNEQIHFMNIVVHINFSSADGRSEGLLLDYCIDVKESGSKDDLS